LVVECRIPQLILLHDRIRPILSLFVSCYQKIQLRISAAVSTTPARVDGC